MLQNLKAKNNNLIEF